MFGLVSEYRTNPYWESLMLS